MAQVKQVKNYKFRLYPTKAQETTLEHTLDLCRELYNAALQERKDAWRAWERTNKGFSFTHLASGVMVVELDTINSTASKPPSLNYYSQANQLSEIKEVRPELNAVYSQVLQDVLKRVQKSFDGFFARVKRGEKAGYPRFQGKGRYDSFCYPQLGWSLNNKELTLAKIGTLKLKLHREVLGKAKTCTIKREGSAWYVVFSVEYEFEVPTQHDGPVVGIDLGLEHFVNQSDGVQTDNPRYFRKAERHLAKIQRRYAKLKQLPRKDSKKIKALKAIRKAHAKVKNQRQDYLHKLSTSIAKTYSLIVVEDLQVKNLSKRAKPKEDEANPGQYLPNGASAKSGLNKSVNDAGWSTFINMLGYKVACTGARLIKVNPSYTSQICPTCGAIKAKELDERWHSCECGAEMHRDIAAAQVIVRIGLDSLRNQSLDAPAFTRGE